MRARFLPFTCILFVGTAQAQIPNGGFESWYSNVNYMEPHDWWTTNGVTWQLSALASVEQGSPAPEGNTFVKVTSRTAGSIVEVGRMTCGNEVTGYPGFPYTQRPTSFDGMVQYHPLGGDQGQVYMTLTKWNPLSMVSEPVGVAVYNVPSAINAWQPFSVAFSYLNGNTPDSARVFVMASMNTPVNGSSIWIDDLHVSGGGVGMAEATAVAGLQVMPVSGGDALLVRASGPMGRIVLLDMAGRRVSVRGTNAVQAELPLTGLPPGVYTLVVDLVDGPQVVRRFVRE